MGICRICGKEKLISENLGICLECIKEEPDKALVYAEQIHRNIRRKFNLPFSPPRTAGGIRCDICYNHCIIGAGEKGYCGLRENIDGILKNKTDSNSGILNFY